MLLSWIVKYLYLLQAEFMVNVPFNLKFSLFIKFATICVWQFIPVKYKKKNNKKNEREKRAIY